MRGHLSRPPDRIARGSTRSPFTRSRTCRRAMAGRSPSDPRTWRRGHDGSAGSGISSDTFERASGGYRWDYAVTELGFKCPMNDIHRARPCPARTRRRRQRGAPRSQRSTAQGLMGFPESSSCGPSRTGRAASISSARSRSGVTISWTSTERGIDVGVHYRPSYLYPMFTPPLRTSSRSGAGRSRCPCTSPSPTRRWVR